jgi:putative ABC transport system substrate-binding protein
MGTFAGIRSAALRSLAVGGALGVAALGLGACGGSSSSNSAPTTAGGSSGATLVTTPSVSVSVPSIKLGGAKFCTQLVDAEQSLTAKLPTIFSEPSEFATIVSTYQTLANEAPSSIKPAVQDVAKAIKDESTLSSNPAALAGLESKLGPDAEELGTWIGMNCHAT